MLNQNTLFVMDVSGVNASQTMVETDLQALNKIKHCYEKVGTGNCKNITHFSSSASIGSKKIVLIKF